MTLPFFRRTTPAPRSSFSGLLRPIFPAVQGVRVWLLAVCSLFAAGVGSLSVAASLPEPLTVVVPARSSAALKVDSTRRGLVEQVSNGASLEPLRFERSPGAHFTLTLWFKVDDAALLASERWDGQTPMTVADLGDAGNGERLIIRLQQGRLVLTSRAGSGAQWQTLALANELDAGKWYFLSVVSTGGRTVVYVNDTFAGFSDKLPALPKIDAITLGSSERRRALRGVIVQPRVYDAVVPRQRLHHLFTGERPSQIPQDGVGRWHLN